MVANTKDPSLDSVVEKLIDEIDESIMDPDKSWNESKKRLKDANATYGKKFSSSEGVKDSAYTDAFNERAKVYLQGLGRKGNESAEQYGVMMTNMFDKLGQQGRVLLEETERAIKRGDEQTALTNMQTAYLAEADSATQARIHGKISNIKDVKQMEEVTQYIGRRAMDLRDNEDVNSLYTIQNHPQLLNSVRKSRSDYRDAKMHNKANDYHAPSMN